MTFSGDKFPFLAGGGELGRLTREFDWAGTPLGAPDGWPQSLRTAISIVLNSSFPMLLWWGDELTQFYNDAFRPSLGTDGKHPSSLGQPAIGYWSENWHIIKPLIDGVMQRGESSYFEDLPIPNYRNGQIETVYWTFSYSPVRDESGGVAAVLMTCFETTQKVQSLASAGDKSEQLEFTIEAAELGAWDYNPLTGKFTGNDRLREWFGLPPEADIALAQATDVIVPRDRQAVIDAIGQAMQWGHGSYDIEYAILPPGAGEERIVRAKGLARFNDDKVCCRLSGTLQDITSQALAQQLVAASEAKLRAIVTNAPVAIGMFVGRDLVIENPNQTFIDIVGKGWSVVGKPLREAMPELASEGQPFLKILDDVYTTGVPFLSPGSLVRIVQQGTLTSRYYNISYSPVRNAAGDIYAILDIAVDVTEQVAAQQHTEEAQEALREAIALAELGTWTMDLDLGKVYYGEPVAAWFGIPSGSSLEAFFGLMPAADAQRMQEVIASAIAPGSGGVIGIEHRVRNPANGRQRIIHSRAQVVGGMEGSNPKIAWTGRDVTIDREVNAALEEQVQMRTEELAAAVEELRATNEELAQANEQLVSSNEELAQYAYVASHDLQEPLRKIQVFTGMVGNAKELLPQTKATIDKINSSAARMSLLIQDLLTFSRLLKSDRLMRPVSLGDLVKDVWDDFELVVAEKNATIEVGELPMIVAVSLQMNQLFTNLISNALKFTAAGRTPHIRITSQPAAYDEVKRYISKPLSFAVYHRITISDNGIGFEPQYQEQIFEVFKRLHGREFFPGSGIGLAICRRIAANHHGYLYASSEYGEGSTFHILLPDRRHD